MITLESVTLDYAEKRVLDKLTLSISTDGITCLHGPSGSGKTTLLRLIAGLVCPTSGAVAGLPQKPALLFQEDRLLPHLSARDNIAAVVGTAIAGAAALGGPLSTADHWLTKVNLSEDAHLRPRELSGGMRRRVALARALAYGGDFLLLDEPFTGLDVKLVEQMAALIRETNTPALVVTHSLEEIRLLGGEALTVSGPPLRIL